MKQLKRLILPLMLLIFFFASAAFAAEKRTATVKEFHGDVQIQRAVSEKTIKVFKNMRLEEGDKIITGKDSKVILTADSDKEITIAANTIAILSEFKKNGTSTDTVITIQAGGVGSKIDKKLDKNSNYKIKTPTAVMGVRGTEFYVQVERKDAKQDRSEVNVWLATGHLQIDYRLDGVNISKFSEDKGDLKTVYLSAPRKYEVPSEGDDFSSSRFELKGLYKEFLDSDEISDMFSDDEIEDALEEAEELEDKLEEETVEEVHKQSEYEDVENKDDDDEDDDEVGAIPPKPAGNYVYIQKYEVTINRPGHPAETRIGRIDRWIPYRTHIDQGTVFAIIFFGEHTGDPVLGNVNTSMLESDLEANWFILEEIEAAI